MEINKKIETILKFMVDEIAVESNKEQKEQIEQFSNHPMAQAKFSWYYKLNEKERELVWKFIDNIALGTITQILHLLSLSDGDGNSPAELYKYKLTADDEEIGEDLYNYFDTVLKVHYPSLFRRLVMGEID